MKNGILIVFILVFAFPCTYAQLAQKNISVGGNILFQTADQKAESGAELGQTDVAFDLRGGYFIMDNLSVGGYIFLQFSRQNSNGFSSSSNTFNIGPLGTYYISLGDQLYIPITVGFGLQTTRINNDAIDGYNLTGFGATIRGGLEIISNNNFGLRFIFGPQFGSYSNQDLGLDVNFFELELGTGIFYYFQRE